MNIEVLRDKKAYADERKWQLYAELEQVKEAFENTSRSDESAYAKAKKAYEDTFWVTGYYSGMADILENLIVNFDYTAEA